MPELSSGSLGQARPHRPVHVGGSRRRLPGEAAGGGVSVREALDAVRQGDPVLLACFLIVLLAC